MSFEIGKIIIALLVLVNPLAALPLFLELTRDFSKRERRQTAQLAGISVLVIITVFALGGPHLLKLLGISTGSFQIGGGILIFLIAIGLMSSGNNPAKPDITGDGTETANIRNKKAVPASIAVVPLAMPMMAGPGGISTVVIYASSSRSLYDTLALITAGMLVALLCYLCLLAASKVSGLLGDTGLLILNRVMGLLLAAVSVEIIVAGLRNLFPQLAG